MASAEIRVAGMRSAIASATSDFPDAVGPKTPRTRGSVTEPAPCPVELLVRRAAGLEVAGDAAVSSLELLEHLHHGGSGRLRDPVKALELRLVGSLREPLLMPGP